MTTMTAQLPLPLSPAAGVPIGSAACLVEDDDGGRVFINGHLSFVWDAGDTALRRFAAVQLVRIKAALALEVAAAFGVDPFTVYRWGQTTAGGGAAALTPGKRGPKGPSKLTDDVVAEVAGRHAQGQSTAEIASAVGISVRSVSTVLARVRAGSGSAAGRTHAAPTVDAASVSASTPVPDVDFDCAAVDSVDQADQAVGDGAADGAVAGSVAGPAGDTGPVRDEPVLPVLPDPVDRSAERAAARWGLLPYAPPVFAPAARVGLAGLFLAVPALTATGLLDSARLVYGGVPDGFYGLDTMLLEAVCRALVGEPRAEGATRVNPTDLGRVLGLDRAPEVKTVRRKLGLLAARGKATELLSAQAVRHAADHPDAMSVVYVDGHVRTYHGTRKLQKTHVPRLRFPAPATVETWIVDAQGAPVWVVMAKPGASLAAEIRRLLPDIRRIVGDDRRVLVGFDRGGWSPALFKDLITAGFDVLTWRKAPAPDVDPALFTAATHVDEHGVTRNWQVADTTVEIPLDDTDPDPETVTLRQVSKRDAGTGRQVHILTSRTDLTAAAVCHRMGARWREENYFRYGRMHFALDAHDNYGAVDDDPDRSVPNPAKKTTHQAVQAARARLYRAETHRDEQLLALRSPQPGTPTTITNQMHDLITAPVRAAHTDLAAAIAAHKATPTRLPLGQVRPGQQVLDTETKLLTHAIRMAAFNTQTMLARTVATATDYRKAGNEAHALVRTALTGTGDIHPTPGRLNIRLDPLHTPRATTALTQLCAVLTDAAAVYPGTDLHLHYSVKPHR